MKKVIGVLSVLAISGLSLSVNAANIKTDAATPKAAAAPAAAVKPAKVNPPSAAPIIENAKKETVKGTVQVVKTEQGTLKEIDLKGVDGKTYILAPISEAMKLEVDQGKAVTITGTVTTFQGKSHLHIMSVAPTVGS